MRICVLIFVQRYTNISGNYSFLHGFWIFINSFSFNKTMNNEHEQLDWDEHEQHEQHNGNEHEQQVWNETWVEYYNTEWGHNTNAANCSTG